MTNNSIKIKLFVSYSHDDDPYFKVFSEQLKKVIKNAEHFEWSVWDDTNIHIGTFWDEEIQNNIKECNIAMLLVSIGFMASKYIKEKEFKEFTKRYADKGILIAPVVFKPCDFNRWEDLGKLQFFKPNGSSYGKSEIEHFTFADLIKFKETDGTLIPNPNIDRYLLALVKKVEESFKEFIDQSEKSQLPISNEPVIINFNKLSDYPKPKPYFVGRKDELKVLNEAYNKNSFIFIEGSGGIGKTQFVAKFIEDSGINDKIVWYECIPTSQPDDLIMGAGFEELLKGKEKTEREKFSAFKDKIEEKDLVVFLDNYQEVENAPAFKTFIAFINEYLKKGHLIILGRDNIIYPELQPKRIRLEGLGEDSLLHAQKLIEHSYPKLIKTLTEDLTKICDTLKGYPLAIDLAIYLLSLNVSAQNIISVAVKESQSAGSHIEKISNRLLNEIFTRPDASEEEKEFLKLFSIFRGKVYVKEAMSVISQVIFEKASRKLIDRNLLEINNDYYELHPLIREFCYNELVDKKGTHYLAAKYYIRERSKQLNPELEEKIFYHLSYTEQWSDISTTIINSGREFILHGYLDRLQQMITIVKQHNIFEPKFDIYEGDIAEIKGNWDVALSIFELAKQSQNEEVKIEGMIKYGEMLFRRGDVKAAAFIYENVIKITKQNSYIKWHARVLNDLGLVNDFFGKLREALNWLNSSLQIRLELGVMEDIAISYYNIGSIKSHLGYYKEALDLYEKSKTIHKEIGDKSGIARCNANIGAIKSKAGLNNEALLLLERSLKIYEEIGDKSGIARILNNIGFVKKELGLKNEVLGLYERSLIISEEIGDKSGVAVDLNNIASYLFDNNGDLEKTCFYLIRSYALYKQIGMPEQKNPFNGLIDVRHKLNKIKFKELVFNSIQKLDEDLKKIIDTNEILGEPIRVEKKVGRNDLCPCKSGKKYKQCHGKDC
jgi:hypothetical protein